MPSKSKAQHNFMAAVANNPSFAKKAGVPQSVGKEFSNADKGRKFSKGGDMKAEMMKKGGLLIVEHGKQTDLTSSPIYSFSRNFGNVHFSFLSDEA